MTTPFTKNAIRERSEEAFIPDKKTCTKCLIEKKLDEFYPRKKGKFKRASECKDCVNKRTSLIKRKRLDYWAKRVRERYHTEEGRKKVLALRKITEERYPEKIKARRMVKKAIKDGVLVRSSCLVCGAEKVQGHHEDYTKPLQVIWLCQRHHMERHRKYPDLSSHLFNE